MKRASHGQAQGQCSLWEWEGWGTAGHPELRVAQGQQLTGVDETGLELQLMPSRQGLSLTKREQGSLDTGDPPPPSKAGQQLHTWC